MISVATLIKHLKFVQDLKIKNQLYSYYWVAFAYGEPEKTGFGSTTIRSLDIYFDPWTVNEYLVDYFRKKGMNVVFIQVLNYKKISKAEYLWKGAIANELKRNDILFKWRG